MLGPYGGEPSTDSTWNAHVKDVMEEHLHKMVCAGKLDLATAQRDIATDWIAAYKRYFHTETPLSVRSALIQSEALADLDRLSGGKR
jgi:hypothetical protein